MKKIYILGVVLLALLLVLSGCGASREQAAYDYADSDDDGYAGDYYATERGYAQEEQLASKGEVAADQGRKLIWNGHININVEDLKISEEKIRGYVRGKGGFIESANFYGDSRGESLRSYLSLRIPAQHFDDGMLFLNEEIGKVTNSSSGHDDVTMVYIDMEARINNLTSQEARYTEILEKADTVEDILKIEAELVRIRGEIESLTARFNHMKDQVNYSTISVNLNQTVLATPGVTTVGFEGAWDRAVESLTKSLNMVINGAANFFVFIFGAIPFIFLIIAVLAIAYLIRRKMGKGKSVD